MTLKLDFNSRQAEGQALSFQHFDSTSDPEPQNLSLLLKMSRKYHNSYKQEGKIGDSYSLEDATTAHVTFF
jgi:hypothetical protein